MMRQKAINAYELALQCEKGPETFGEYIAAKVGKETPIWSLENISVNPSKLLITPQVLRPGWYVEGGYADNGAPIYTLYHWAPGMRDLTSYAPDGAKYHPIDTLISSGRKFTFYRLSEKIQGEIFMGSPISKTPSLNVDIGSKTITTLATVAVTLDGDHHAGDHVGIKDGHASKEFLPHTGIVFPWPNIEWKHDATVFVLIDPEVVNMDTDWTIGK